MEKFIHKIRNKSHNIFVAIHKVADVIGRKAFRRRESAKGQAAK